MTLAAVVAQLGDRQVVTALCAAAGQSCRDLRARGRDAPVPTELCGTVRTASRSPVYCRYTLTEHTPFAAFAQHYERYPTVAS
ncbi:hypothetical protein ACIQH6_29000 [Micromonospora orduensis]|uniref:hypothetical protein n=1 Tax=Micromonospora orduensis TaxID=1420891 RepID=UPI0037F31510